MNIEEKFEKFWALYDYKKARAKVVKKWGKLSDCERDKAIASAPIYTKSTPNKKFRKHPLTWLNQECWDDEVIECPELPFSEIFDLYNKTLPELRQIIIDVSEADKSNIVQIWEYHEDHQSLEWWQEYFEYVSQSKYLMGKADNGFNNFKASFYFLIKLDNFFKIASGYYHD